MYNLFKRRPQTLVELRSKAARGDVNAQCELGEHFLQGNGVAKSGRNAKYWFNKAARRGFLEAQSRLGYCYEKGIGCLRNRQKAIHWTKSAAQGGHAAAQARYASYFERGFINSDYNRRYIEGNTEEWYCHSARQGNAEAQVWMGKHCLNMTTPNLLQATDWYSRAALQGNAEAQRMLSQCFDNLKKQEEKNPQIYSEITASPNPLSINLDSSTTLLGQEDYEKAQRLIHAAQYKKALPFLAKSANASYPPAYGTLLSLYSNGGCVGERDAGRVIYYRQKFVAQLDWFKKFSLQGDAIAQLSLGYCYLQGLGVEKNTATAIQLFRKAAQQGNLTAIENLGKLYSFYDDSVKNEPMAFQFFLQAVMRGSIRAELDFGECYEYGRGVTKSEGYAFKRYQRAAEQGDSFSQYALAHCYHSGTGIPKNNAMALQWCHKAVDQGNAKAQCLLGAFYLDGIIINKDEKLGIEYWRKSAEQGNAGAQCCLAKLYQTGEGVRRNKATAIQWFRKAAEQGDSEAKEHLKQYEEEEKAQAEKAQALRDLQALEAERKAKEEREREREREWKKYEERRKYENILSAVSLNQSQINLLLKYADDLWRGDCTREEYKRQDALKYYRKAAEQGDPKAQIKYGKCLQGCYYTSEDKRDYKQAFEWFNKAATQNYTDAFLEVGSCYERERGVTKNLEAAIRWYCKAGDAGNYRGYSSVASVYTSVSSGLYNPAEALVWYRKSESLGNNYVAMDIALYEKISNRADNIQAEKAVKIKADKTEKFRRDIGVMYESRTREYRNALTGDDLILFDKIAAEEKAKAQQEEHDKWRRIWDSRSSQNSYSTVTDDTEDDGRYEERQHRKQYHSDKERYDNLRYSDNPSNRYELDRLETKWRFR